MREAVGCGCWRAGFRFCLLRRSRETRTPSIVSCREIIFRCKSKASRVDVPDRIARGFFLRTSMPRVSAGTTEHPSDLSITGWMLGRIGRFKPTLSKPNDGGKTAAFAPVRTFYDYGCGRRNTEHVIAQANTSLRKPCHSETERQAKTHGFRVSRSIEFHAPNKSCSLTSPRRMCVSLSLSLADEQDGFIFRHP